jgi:putative endonuclease
MKLLPKIVFAMLRRRSRKGLSGGAAASVDWKQAALRTGVDGETYAYWYLRTKGYVFIARNYQPVFGKGELDLIGYDGETLAIVEVRTRAVDPTKPAQPEMSITPEKHWVLVRTARQFLRERHIKECPVRFDVVGIDHAPGKEPVVRLHKDALSPAGPPYRAW